MKNVIYLSNSIIPSQYANSVHVMKMCQAFKMKGFEVNLIYYTPSKSSNIEKIFDDYGVIHKFKLTPMYIKNDRRKFFQNFIKIYRYLKKIDRRTLIYGRDIYSVYLASMMGFKVSFESHGKPFLKIHEFLERRLYKEKNFQKLIVISERLKNIYIENNYLVSQNMIKVLHDGADLTNKKINRSNLGNGFNIGYIGSLYYEGRGINLILNLAKENTNLNFHLVGGKEDEINYWKEKASSNVKFYGFKPNNIALEYLLSFDVVLMPYQKNLKLEGMEYNTLDWMSPMKMFEYMSAGKAIISSDFPVIREVLNESNSILVESDNLPLWSKAIKDLHKNKEYLNRISTKALYDFENNYTWEKRVESLLSSMTKKPLE